MYSAEGKPGISPIILAFISVFQFMEKLADRQAVNALRMRVEWKYTLRLPLEDEGFDFSVLSEFRDGLSRRSSIQKIGRPNTGNGIDPRTC